MFDFCRKKFGTEPDYPFTKDFNTAVLRHGDTKKWYGIIINVDKKVFGFDSGERTDILNVKADPLMMGSFLAEKGVFPAYHMSKSSWVSVLLDGTCEKELIEVLLNISYRLTDKKNKRIKSRL